MTREVQPSFECSCLCWFNAQRAYHIMASCVHAVAVSTQAFVLVVATIFGVSLVSTPQALDSQVWPSKRCSQPRPETKNKSMT